LGRVIVFVGEKLECQREEANEQDPYPYAVAIVKQVAGCMKNTGGWIATMVCSLYSAKRKY